MLRMRRTLAFSARIHNYLLLLYLFSLGLFFSQLWWDITDQFGNLVGTFNTLLAMVGLAHAAVLLAMSLLLWLIDRVFPAWDFWGTILRAIMFAACHLLVTLYSTVTAEGLTLRF